MRINHDLGASAPSLTRLFIAVPSYDGQMCYQFTGSLLETKDRLKAIGIECDVRFAVHMEIQIARNVLVKEFMASECTHIFFVDSDQGWDADKIVEMIKMDQLFISGAIRYKQDEEEYPLKLDVNADMSLKYGPFNLVKAHEIGVALAIIKREVFDILKKKHTLNFTFKYGMEFFKFYIRGNSYQGEDNHFCELCRTADIPIYIYPNINTKHIGRKEYIANFDNYLRSLPGGDLDEARIS